MTKPTCSFCGASEDKVKKLIVADDNNGSFLSICDLCIDKCTNIIKEKRKVLDTKTIFEIFLSLIIAAWRDVKPFSRFFDPKQGTVRAIFSYIVATLFLIPPMFFLLLLILSCFINILIFFLHPWYGFWFSLLPSAS